ncbi:MAG: hypothetical protein KF886_03040 [Candidatus Hydrogenedentes bacterium]|nr:hypothetical protein [Candidatus Hydrogenedentota bacterium]
MECPICSRSVTQAESPDGELRIWCAACGWGAGPGGADVREERPAGGGAAPLWQVALLWAVAVAVVVGPYFALRFGLPALFDVGLRGAGAAHAKYVTALNGWYPIVMGAYLAAAGLFTPAYDRDNVGWFGGLLDNPFSLQDDWERTKRTWLFVLLPGKTVWVALKLTWRRVRG